MKKLTTAGLAVTGLLITSTVASAQALCVLPIMISAAIVAAKENRELTQKEAMWCGLVRDDEGVKKMQAEKAAKAARKNAERQ
ncbi:MAG TPA: hypothetical protein VHD59_15015 [Pseudolabrys sp.]|jgi:hypothetical protein|nr:hypothetical protein [Pseudolabrys sp.]